MEQGISLEMAELLTGCSRRTWWRRLQQGRVQRVAGSDARGRTLLPLAAVLPLLPLRLAAADTALVHAADRGDAQALNELAQLFAQAAHWAVAEQLWLAAARRDHADAMQQLGMLYLRDRRSPEGSRALVWLARAAEAGHPLACAQLRGLWQALRR
ncbi:hypothetical protein [Pseudomonas sp. NPDC007930]|uniref:hypothetical protein n=1 Tax=Pseudomonas sp. NPDC007930 TaxID=3364417 RepID=UPI0036EE355C